MSLLSLLLLFDPPLTSPPLHLGQGPYFGQAAWFLNFHPEKIPSAVERYIKEVRRVLGVLDNILVGKEYLVGDRVSYADLSFVSWNWALDFFAEHIPDWQEEFPNTAAWNARLNARPAVKKTRAEKTAVA